MCPLLERYKDTLYGSCSTNPFASSQRRVVRDRLALPRDGIPPAHAHPCKSTSAVWLCWLAQYVTCISNARLRDCVHVVVGAVREVEVAKPHATMEDGWTLIDAFTDKLIEDTAGTSTSGRSCSSSSPIASLRAEGGGPLHASPRLVGLGACCVVTHQLNIL